MTSAQAYFANCSNDNNNPAFSKNSPLWKPLKTCVFGARKRRRGRRKAKQPGSEYGGKNRFQRYPDTCWQGLNQESLLNERRQRHCQKSIGFTSKKVALHLHHEFYYIFDVLMRPFMEDLKIYYVEFSFPCLNLDEVLS